MGEIFPKGNLNLIDFAFRRTACIKSKYRLLPPSFSNHTVVIGIEMVQYMVTVLNVRGNVIMKKDSKYDFSFIHIVVSLLMEQMDC